MTGSGRMILEDGCLVEGRFRDGCLHGLARLAGAEETPVHTQPLTRKLDAKRRLVWVGRYLGGRPSGVCWSFVSGGGMVVGKVDSEGKLTGDEVVFL